MKTLPLPPLSSVPQNLLADFICAPVSMRADRFFATVADLHAITAGTVPQQRAQALEALRADMGDDDEPWPWEEPIFTVNQGLAILRVDGPLVKGYDDFTCWWFGLASTDRIQAALEELASRVDVAAIIVRLNTPGGVSIGMPETADQIVALDEVKPVFAVTSDMAASNGYRLAAACRAFFATRSAVVGSIGTYIALYDYSEYLKDMGIKLELFRDGALKGIGVFGKSITDDERKFLEGVVARSGKIFKDFVRARRPGVEESTMQGQWFDGEQAVGLGLVDSVVNSELEVIAQIRAQIQPAGFTA